MGELVNKSDRVAKQDGRPRFRIDHTNGGIQRGKEPVIDINRTIGEVIHERRFAGVGVPDDGDAQKPIPVPSLCRAIFFRVLKIFFQSINTTSDLTAIQFNLPLADAPHSDTAALTL